MKLTDPRLTLLAGLALALNQDGIVTVQAAGGTKPSVKLVQAQTNGPTTVPPRATAPGSPAASATSLDPIPDPANITLNPQPPADPSQVTTVPLQLGTQPALAPTYRPPLGLHYGESDQLDANQNPSPRPLAPATTQGVLPTNPEEVPMARDGSGSLVPMDVGVVHGGTDRFGFAPPPGTLGQTYKRRSRPIEDTKHPRVGAVEVNLPEWVDVSAKGLKVKWTGKVWRLESDSLIPGVPHIYEVKASWGEGTQPQVRTIRLIMGRIVDLDF